MRRYTTKNEEDLIQQIESDPELDKGWEPVEGHVVEIKYVDVAERARLVKPRTRPAGAGYRHNLNA